MNKEKNAEIAELREAVTELREVLTTVIVRVNSLEMLNDDAWGTKSECSGKCEKTLRPLIAKTESKVQEILGRENSVVNKIVALESRGNSSDIKIKALESKAREQLEKIDSNTNIVRDQQEKIVSNTKKTREQQEKISLSFFLSLSLSL